MAMFSITSAQRQKLTFFLHVFSITSADYPSFFLPLFWGVVALHDKANPFNFIDLTIS
jgi:hypothetical protein